MVRAPTFKAQMALRNTLLTIFASTARASIYYYSDAWLQPDVIQYRRVGMFAPHDAPATSHLDDGSSTVSVELTLRRTDATKGTGLVQLLIFNAVDLLRVGAKVGNAPRSYCCTAALAAHGVPGCHKAGRLIVSAGPSGTDDTMLVVDVPFATNESDSSISQHFTVQTSGMHYLVLSSCDLHTGAVLYSGRTSWKNPYGYLPGELYSFLPFFGTTAILYLVLTAMRAYLCHMHWSQLLTLQLAIAWVLVLGVVESSVWYMAYQTFNESGARGMLPTTLGVLISTLRKTVARLLVLAVCLGYGVVRPTLGSAAYRIGAFGAVYFVFAATLDVLSNTSNLAEYSVPARILFIAPVGLLDIAFYCASLSSAFERTPRPSRLHVWLT